MRKRAQEISKESHRHNVASTIHLVLSQKRHFNIVTAKQSKATTDSGTHTVFEVFDGHPKQPESDFIWDEGRYATTYLTAYAPAGQTVPHPAAEPNRAEPSRAKTSRGWSWVKPGGTMERGDWVGQKMIYNQLTWCVDDCGMPPAPTHACSVFMGADIQFTSHCLAGGRTEYLLNNQPLN